MMPIAPQIGFDRYIPIDWSEAALRVRAGLEAVDHVDQVLALAGLGKEARAKTKTKLNALWLIPRADLLDLADRGARLFRERPNMLAAPLSWGMAIATY